MRRQPGLAIGILSFALATVLASSAAALTITDQVGTEAIGGVGVEITLSGLNDTHFALDGWIRDTATTDMVWTHTYAPITDTILSATLQVDLIDADTGVLDLFAGTSTSDPLIGTASGANQGTDEWRDLQSPPGSNPGDGSYDNLIVIPASLFADLADGTFQIFTNDRNDTMTTFGSNRALLTITVVPEPATGALVALGLIPLALLARRRS